MNIILGIFLTLCIFTIIVVIHELGHYIAARFFWVKVEEFGVGIPPKAALLHTDAHGTQWTLNFVPIGGFVRLFGEEKKEGVSKKGAYWSQSIPARMIIVLGGVFCNFLLTWILFSGAFWYGVQPLGVNQQFPQVETAFFPTMQQADVLWPAKVSSGVFLYPITGSPAEQAGILSGSLVVSVNGKNIFTDTDFLDRIQESSPKISLNILSGSQIVSYTLQKNTDGRIGAYVARNEERNFQFTYRYAFGEAVREGWYEMGRQAKLLLFTLKDVTVKLFTGTSSQRQEAAEVFSGPIGVGKFFVSYARVGVDTLTLLVIAGLISLNLGVFNLLPFPALDGGRFLFLLIEAVLGRFVAKHVFEKLEKRSHAVGFLLLMGAAIVISIKDIFSLFVS